MTTYLSMAAAGFAFGAATSLMNAGGGAFLAQFLGMGWSWTALGVVIGWVAQTRRSALFGATGALLAAVLAYYALDLALGVYATRDSTDPAVSRTVTDWAAAFGDVFFWSVSALLVGPALGVVGHAIHREDVVGLLAELVVPIAMVANVALVALPLDGVQQQPEVVAHVVIALVGVLWAGWALARRWSEGRPRVGRAR